MIVATHLAKTGGRSFQTALKEALPENMIVDSGDNFFHKNFTQRHEDVMEDKIRIQNHNEDRYSNIKLIHGHFMPVKYLSLPSKMDTKFTTWMREPIERLYSHYYYWKDRYNPKNKKSVVQIKMMEENWTLEDFCFAPEIRNYYDQVMWGFPFERFDFIGITEHYNEDLKFFADNILGIELQSLHENKGKTKYNIDPVFRRELEIFHSADIRLYQEALNKREKRKLSS